MRKLTNKEIAGDKPCCKSASRLTEKLPQISSKKEQDSTRFGKLEMRKKAKRESNFKMIIKVINRYLLDKVNNERIASKRVNFCELKPSIGT